VTKPPVIARTCMSLQRVIHGGGANCQSGPVVTPGLRRRAVR
jgi:hypothetical protein